MDTLQGTNISHLGKRKIIFKMPFLGERLVPWRVAPVAQWSNASSASTLLETNIVPATDGIPKKGNDRLPNIIFLGGKLLVSGRGWDLGYPAVFGLSFSSIGPCPSAYLKANMNCNSWPGCILFMAQRRETSINWVPDFVLQP